MNAETTWYLLTERGAFKVGAPSPQAAKRLFRAAFGLRKMPSGSVISSDPGCGFFVDAGPFEALPAIRHPAQVSA